VYDTDRTKIDSVLRENMLVQIDENSATLTPFGSLARQTPANARPGEAKSWAAGRNEAREALVLSVAGVTAIMLITNLLLMILY
jgi:hypothetical protein